MSALSRAPYNAPSFTYSWNGMRVAYSRKGSGPPLLLLHSLNGGGSAYEMRRVYASLNADFDVFAPDLPGFGKSERRRMDYTAEGYITFLKQFHADVIGRPCCVVASSLAAAYVIQVAHEAPEAFSKLVLVAPTGIRALAGKRRSMGQKLARALLFSPVGNLIFKLLSTPASIRYFMTTQAFYDPKAFSDDYAEQLYETMHQPNARYGPTAFLTGAAHWNVAEAFGKLRQPVLIAWGREARPTTLDQADDFLARNRRARLEVFEKCSLVPHDEHADRFNAVTRHFLMEEG